MAREKLIGFNAMNVFAINTCVRHTFLYRKFIAFSLNFLILTVTYFEITNDLFL